MMYDIRPVWGGELSGPGMHHYLIAGQQHQQPHTTHLHSPRHLQTVAFCALLPTVSQLPVMAYVTTRLGLGLVMFNVPLDT